MYIVTKSTFGAVRSEWWHEKTTGLSNLDYKCSIIQLFYVELVVVLILLCTFCLKFANSSFIQETTFCFGNFVPLSFYLSLAIFIVMLHSAK